MIANFNPIDYNIRIRKDGYQFIGTVDEFPHMLKISNDRQHTFQLLINALEELYRTVLENGGLESFPAPKPKTPNDALIGHMGV